MTPGHVQLAGGPASAGASVPVSSPRGGVAGHATLGLDPAAADDASARIPPRSWAVSSSRERLLADSCRYGWESPCRCRGPASAGRFPGR